MLRNLFRRLRLSSVQAGADERRGVDNVDAMAATASHGGRLDPQGGNLQGGAPPNYVKTDEGRPRP
jgi:hypothetical protein